jgi:hypothetical protein
MTEDDLAHKEDDPTSVEAAHRSWLRRNSTRIVRPAIRAYWRFRVYDWPVAGPLTSRIRGRRQLAHTVRYFSRPERLEKLAAERPPPDERITFPGFWLAEVFTPSTYSQLESGMDALGLNKTRTAERDFAREARTQAWAGSWSNLAWITADKNRMLVQSIHDAHLPAALHYAVPTLLTLTPSLTVLVVQFHVRDEAAVALDAAIRAEYTTKGSVNRDGSVSFTLPDMVRDEALANVRHELRNAAQVWIRRYFRGAFASLDDDLPAADLVLLEKAEPFPNNREPAYLGQLGLSSAWPPFATDELPGVKLAVREPFGDEAVLRFASKRGTALGHERLTHYATQNEFSLLQLLHEALAKNVAHYALIQLLMSYHRALSELRDVAPTTSTRTRTAVRRLTNIHAGSVATSVDIRNATSDILETFTDAQTLRRNATEWRSCDEREKEPVELAEEWLWELRERATRLGALEERIRDALQTDAALLSAVANLRVQRFLWAATFVAVVVAIASLAVTLWALERPAKTQRRGATTGAWLPHYARSDPGRLRDNSSLIVTA